MTAKVEIHRIRVEECHESSSVKGKVSGMSYGGTGTVSGSTETQHTSSIFANGRTYQLKQKNQQYPFRVGDDIVVAFSRNKKTGVNEVEGLVNLTNGTKLMPNIKMLNVAIWGAFLFSIPMMLLLIGFLLAPFFLGVGIWYSFFIYPHLKKAFEALDAIAEAEKSQVDTHIEQANRQLGVAA